MKRQYYDTFVQGIHGPIHWRWLHGPFWEQIEQRAACKSSAVTDDQIVAMIDEENDDHGEFFTTPSGRRWVYDEIGNVWRRQPYSGLSNDSSRSPAQEPDTK